MAHDVLCAVTHVHVEVDDGHTSAAHAQRVRCAHTDAIHEAEATTAGHGIEAVDHRMMAGRAHEAKGAQWRGALIGPEHLVDGGDDGAGSAPGGAHGASGHDRHASHGRGWEEPTDHVRGERLRVTQLAMRKGALDLQERIEVLFGVHAPQRRIRCQFKVTAK